MIETLDIPTMFKRGGIKDGFKVYPELADGCEWVKDRTDILLSIKLDGTLCKITVDPLTLTKKLQRKVGELYFDINQEDPHPMDKAILEAYQNASEGNPLPSGFYVAFGPSINDNKQEVPEHNMVRIAPPDGTIIIGWGQVDIKRGVQHTVEEFFNSIRKELEESTVQGFVFNWEQPTMTPYKLAQVTRKDFGFKWPVPPTVPVELTDPYVDMETFQMYN